MIVVVHPLRREEAYLVEVFPVVLLQPFIAHRPDEALYIGILLRLAGLYVFQPDAFAICPRLNQAADVLRADIAAKHCRSPTPLHDLVKRTNDALRRQREVDLDAQRLAVVVVDDVEQPEVAAIAELVVHEVHRPYLIDGGGHHQWFGFLLLQTLLGLDPQVQFQFPVDAIHPLVIPGKALDVAQIQIAQPEAPVALVVCQSHQPVGDLFALGIALRLVPLAGFAYREEFARQVDRHAVFHHNPFGLLAAA